MNRATKIVLWLALAGAGCLGSYQPPKGSGSGSKQPGSSSGGSSGGSSSGGSSSSGGGSSSPSGGSDLGSSNPAPADMAMPTSPDGGVDPGTPTSATPSCDLLVQCCQGDPDCEAQFTGLSEGVCAGLLAGFQAQGACL